MAKPACGDMTWHDPSHEEYICPFCWPSQGGEKEKDG